MEQLTVHDSYEGSKGEGKFCLTLGGFRGIYSGNFMLHMLPMMDLVQVVLVFLD